MKNFLKTIRTLSLVLVLGVVLFAMTACDGFGVDNSKKIIFYHTMGDSLQQVLETAKAKFEAKFPGWVIEHTQVGGYDDVKSAVVADLQGQTQPSLAYCYADHVAQYLTTKKVVDMSKYINSTEQITYTSYEYEMDGEDYKLDEEGNKIVASTVEAQEVVGYTAAEIEDFVKGYYNEGFATNYADYEKYGYSATSILTLPFVKSTELVYYNKTALVDCGIVDAAGKAKAPVTWDELWEDAAIIKAKYPDSTPVGYDSEANWFITMCEQNGWGYTSATEPHYLFKGEKQAQWLDTLAGYYDKGYLTTQSAYGSYTSNLFTKGVETGVTFSIGSSGGANHQKPADGTFEWGVARLPGSLQSDGTIAYKAISQGPSLCMFFEDVENAEEKALMTWEFVKILLEPDFLAAFSIASGYNPPRQSTFDIEAYQDHLNGTSITAAAARAAATMVDDFFTSPALVGSSTARTQVGNVLVYAMTGQKTAEKALADAYVNCGGK